MRYYQAYIMLAWDNHKLFSHVPHFFSAHCQFSIFCSAFSSDPILETLSLSWLPSGLAPPVLGWEGENRRRRKKHIFTFLFTFRMHQILDTRISVLCPSDFVTLVLPPLGSKTGWTGELWSKTSLLKNKRIALFCQFSFFYNFRFFETKNMIFPIFFLHFQFFWDF